VPPVRPRLRELRCVLAAARHARMLRSPKLQCKSGRAALGSSRFRLRTPASAGHPAQSSTGRDNGALRRCVWARCGGNGWGECGEAIGIFVWERNLGVENRRGREDLTTVVANARFASPCRGCGPATGGRGIRLRRPRRTGSVYDLHLLPTRGIGRRTSAWKWVGAARCRSALGYSWWAKVALVLAPIGQAVVGSPLWPRLSPNTMCAARCVMPRLR
jgi:hypothetical protein